MSGRPSFSWLIIALSFAGSLWIRSAFPIYAIGPSIHDDALFLRLADSIARGQWLGEYDDLTLAKGAAYPVFIAVTYRLGISLKFAEHFLYLLSALYLSIQLGHKLRSRALATGIFVLLAFNPVFWFPDVGARVVRENLYISLSMLLVAIAIHVYVRDPAPTPRAEVDAHWPALALLGIVGAVFWLTREEGAWLLPAMLMFIGYGIARQVKERKGGARLAVVLGIPAFFFLALLVAVNSLNLARYGVYRNNDFRSEDFQAAYGALARIKQDHWRNFVVFPADARQRTYSVSPAARELKPYLETRDLFLKVSCEQTQGRFCDEIHSGWFMWALRTAVAGTGHYINAPEAQRFYLRLAAEINGACDRHEIECAPPNRSLVPPWRAEFIRLIAEAAPRLFMRVAKLGDSRVSVVPSVGDHDQLASFERLTHDQLAMANDPVTTTLRFEIAGGIAHLLVEVWGILLPAALVAWLALLILGSSRCVADHVVVLGLLIAIGMRIGLLTFLDATSIPSDNALYPSPAVPFALAIVPCVALLAMRQISARLKAGRLAPRTNLPAESDALSGP